MKVAYALVLVLVTACGEPEQAAETTVPADTAPTEVAVKAAPPTLDSLLVRLDGAGGFYWPKTGRQLVLSNATLPAQDFRAHGRDGVQRLIDCMNDTTLTTTYHAEDPTFKYPRGVLCYELLRNLVDLDASRELPIESQDLYVSMERGQVRPELLRAQRAWRVIFDARAFRLRSMPESS
ncbi:MAG TPA: hypothetical protein VGD27_06155 [Longimicrobiales bacterium]